MVKCRREVQLIINGAINIWVLYNIILILKGVYYEEKIYCNRYDCISVMFEYRYYYC